MLIDEAKRDALHAATETPFYISSKAFSARPRHVLKDGDTFAIFDNFGDIGGGSAGGQDGLFHRDTRFLSRFELSLNGMHPLLLGSDVRDDNALLTVDLTNPDLYFEKRLALPKDTLHITRSIFLWKGMAHQRLAIRNHGECAVDINLALVFAADFADLFEVRGMRRSGRGTTDTQVDGTKAVDLTYHGLDGRRRRTTLVFDPPPTALGKSIASYAVSLAPLAQVSLFVAAGCDHPDARPPPFLRSLRARTRNVRTETRGFAAVETSHDIFNEVLCRSRADLQMLVTRTPDGPYPYAGIPWYSTTFGRDGLITAIELLWCDPGLARGVLMRLAAHQATREDAYADAEPGKILHEMRFGEMAALREVPFSLYYGSVDSTPLFVMLACLYAGRTGDTETLRRLWPHIEAALAWIDGPGDKDGDGFVEYDRANEQGLVNQGWKDSYDAVFHADGRLAQGPIAICEVQGYVFAAKRLAAAWARKLEWPDRARELETQAAQLARKFEEAFWCPQIESYALALDGEKRPCCVRTSNAGHALFAGIARPEHARRVAKGLMGPTFFSGWGFRTVCSGEQRYNPMSYHNGSVWPHDNALIAYGLARYRLKSSVDRVFRALFDAAVYMELRRLPELFCGFQRRRGRGPTLYPVACSPQAWAAATPFALLQASLGLEFEPELREIRLRNPRLPGFLNEVTIRNLALAGAAVDLSIQRHGDGVSVRVIRGDHVQVSVLYG